jgi:histidine triad (HIT) family protein
MEGRLIMDDCLFCKIVEGEIPSQKVYEDADVLAFKDINPLAPIHILVIPKKHIKSLAHMESNDENLIAKIFVTIDKISEEQGFKEDGYRVISNCGKNGGQEVQHLHFHILGGKKLGTKMV